MLGLPRKLIDVFLKNQNLLSTLYKCAPNSVRYCSNFQTTFLHASAAIEHNASEFHIYCSAKRVKNCETLKFPLPQARFLSFEEGCSKLSVSFSRSFQSHHAGRT